MVRAACVSGGHTHTHTHTRRLPGDGRTRCAPHRTVPRSLRPCDLRPQTGPRGAASRSYWFFSGKVGQPHVWKESCLGSPTPRTPAWNQRPAGLHCGRRSAGLPRPRLGPLPAQTGAGDTWPRKSRPIPGRPLRAHRPVLGCPACRPQAPRRLRTPGRCRRVQYLPRGPRASGTSCPSPASPSPPGPDLRPHLGLRVWVPASPSLHPLPPGPAEQGQRRGPREGVVRAVWAHNGPAC